MKTDNVCAKIIADSISPAGARLTTLEVTFHRYVLAELNTHRAFSRNSASSRARSVKKTIVEVRENPAIPPIFPQERKGMSGGETLQQDDYISALNEWLAAAADAVMYAERLAALDVHKSVVNRLLEPFMWHTAVITATEWDNFFSQRLALNEDGTPVADPAMYALALAMKERLDWSEPIKLTYGEWHLPYVTADDWAKVGDNSAKSIATLRKISVARCAGVSYLTQGLKFRDIDKDIALYERLRNANPPHWSPFEHVATPAAGRDAAGNHIQFFNLSGWASLRWSENAITSWKSSWK